MARIPARSNVSRTLIAQLIPIKGNFRRFPTPSGDPGVVTVVRRRRSVRFRANSGFGVRNCISGDVCCRHHRSRSKNCSANMSANL